MSEQALSLPRRLIANLGARAAGVVALVGDFVRLAFQATYLAFTPPYEIRLIANQVVEIGMRSLTLAGLSSFFVGLVLAVQTGASLVRFGAKLYVGIIVSLSIVRELGPVLTALMVGGRVGSGITAEVGSMQVSEQVDAMRALGANPIKKLVVPKVVATVIVLPLLTVMAIVLGILGGGVISAIELDISFNFYLSGILRTVRLNDFLSGVGKTVFFGYLIALIGCFNGFRTRGGTVGVGKATTTTVVAISLAVMISDFFLTKLFLLIEGR